MIDFIGKKNIFIVISLLLIVASLVSIFSKGFNLGVEFLGGSEIILSVQDNVDESFVRETIKNLAPEFESARVTQIKSIDDPKGITKFSIVVSPRDENGELRVYSGEEKEQVSNKIVELFKEKGKPAKVIGFNETSGYASQEIKNLTWKAVVFTLLAILLYITLRFQFVFGVGAVVALIHDVVITLGFFSFFNYELNVAAIAAVLTLIGYSLNDTIVVYDRIRENLKRTRGKSIENIVNDSINQVIKRTINTSLTTFIVIFVLLLFSGNSIKPFAFGMTIGTIIGTYSSLYIASPVVIKWIKK
ncbi:preprotein translocase subunit SecF [Thermosipho melanesiensis]|uniref:Protein-export membrane protein SecF n=2 Tax=Thermosipho melanesiensis TaxID=46541 RepID=A6LP85_THEM4|nr:protein translocase subunit SecF [Thermosipho melanesiensis]ABR31736.1 protein-export membrane protein SecF [Thermosipho melanesiensis BI429]APT74758.1 preprotein translocase subunit SecF [Thermosipho melanesiensis]OOC35077.1 preprotein translocase subunit SecF [Thermosipho melanesiensis]OOC35113.1 preprotein translocase subunit SecF [Thermosipho melanesiensis]OOC36721.1 preprotein translocase subunit SecF [Thermosipho melanesiensis]